MILRDMTILDPDHETARQRDARLSREAARRSREWRDRQRKERAPDSRATAAAVAEAVALFALAGASTATARDFLPDAAGPTMSLRAIAAAAAIILRRQGYSFNASCLRVRKILEPRSDHDSPVHVPSRRAIEGPALMLPPRGADRWTDAELKLMRTFMKIGDRVDMRGS